MTTRRRPSMTPPITITERRWLASDRKTYEVAVDKAQRVWWRTVDDENNGTWIDAAERQPVFKIEMARR